MVVDEKGDGSKRLRLWTGATKSSSIPEHANERLLPGNVSGEATSILRDYSCGLLVMRGFARKRERGNQKEKQKQSCKGR